MVSLRLRLTLWYGVLLALGLVVFGTLLYVVLRTNLERQVDESLRLRAAQIARGLAPGPDGLLDAGDLSPGQLAPLNLDQAVGPDLYVQIFNHRAAVVGSAGSRLPIDPELVLSGLEGRATLVSLPLGSDRTIRLLTRPVHANGSVIGVIQVGDTLDALETTLTQVRGILLLTSIAVLMLAGAGGLWLAGRALAPIRRVSALAREVTATGDYGQRLPAHRAADEIGELVGTFNALIERVESSLSEQQRFLADTSHELRSPLTVIRANLGFLWRETDSETRAECLREAETEAARMTRLVTDLLLLGQGDGGEFLRRTPVRLDTLLLEVAEQVTGLAEGRRVDLQPLEMMIIDGDRDRLKQLLVNLVDNALRHASSSIRLGLSQRGDGIELVVADDGQGIAPEHLPLIFDRFYRVDKARSRGTGGTGLGLAIVKHIAQAHGGSVAVESVVGEGTRFTVRLPLPAPSVLEAVPVLRPDETTNLAALEGIPR